ncbi:MAG: hypothetical protein ABSH20_19635, partial [Tepidisphaeraceae bacterium]
MTKTIRLIAAAAGMVVLFHSSGCTYVPAGGGTTANASGAAADRPKPGPRRVSVQSRWAYSGDESRPTSAWMLERARLSALEGGAGLNKLLQRWPDVTLDLLRESVAVETDLPLRLAIAEAYDRIFALAEGGPGWSTALSAAGSDRQAYARFRQAREKVLVLIQSGSVSEAARIDPAAALPTGAPPALQTEAFRLAGLTALLDDKPVRAAELFARADRSAQAGSRPERFESGLLLSEAERRQGHTAAAVDAWKSAIAAGASVRNPALWERAILGRPTDADWPAEAAIAGVDEPGFTADASPDTGDVLIGIGKMRMWRGETQLAMLAFSRAEAETLTPAKKALARLYRAQTMIVLQQAASALPMLEALVTQSDPRIALRAAATEGDLLCRVLNDRQHGIPMLRNSIERPD